MAGVDRAQERSIEKCRRRRSVGTEAILTGPVVDSSLHADAGVDDPDECGRDSDVRCAAPVDTGRETDHVSEDAAADREHGFAATVDAEGIHHVHYLGDAVPLLRCLMRLERNDGCRDAVVRKVRADCVAVEAIDGVVDYDETTVARRYLRLGAGREKSVVAWTEQAVRLDDLVADLFDRLDGPRGLIDNGVVEPLLESGAVSHREVQSMTEIGSG